MDGYVGTSGQVALPHFALMQAALDRASSGLLGVDDHGMVLVCNRAAMSMLGVELASVDGPLTLARLLDASGALDPAERAKFASILGAAPTPSAQIATRSGTILCLTVSKQPAAQVIAAIEIEPRTGLGANSVDALTGLLDRAGFHERLATLLVDMITPDHVALLMIDLDRFKAVNDTHGHPVGDALLQMVAKRLRSAVRQNDVVSRLGGDEFAVAMRVPADAETTAARLVDLLSRPYLIEGQIMVIGASIGLAIGARDATDTASLLRAADLALYQAKGEGRRTVRVFDKTLDEQARARSNLLIDLQRALALEQFELHFQPQTKLATGKLVGFEALIRWRHPQLGLIPPDRFIPMAEESGLIAQIGEWVLRTACREAASWSGNLSVAVNVSPKQLQEPDRLLRAVQAALTFGGIEAARLEIEITESSLMLPGSAVLDALQAIRKLGVRVSMDDFGTGYSSLSQLRSFPFDKLKIDRSFVTDLAGNAESIAVIRAIAALGASLGMTTTAEGVETPEQAAIIRADGCTDMQGYLVSRPVPAADVAQLIERIAANVSPKED